jgi:conserved oligomeric Golgi complex subunit 8
LQPFFLLVSDFLFPSKVRLHSNTMKTKRLFYTIARSLKKIVEEVYVSSSMLQILVGTEKSEEMGAEYVAYAGELSVCDLDYVRAEPGRLRVEGRETVCEMEKLAFRNYKAFIGASQTVGAVRSEASEARKIVENILDERIDSIGSHCQSFIESARQLEAQREKARVMLKYRRELLTLLEIPQQMDTLVRSGSGSDVASSSSSSPQQSDLSAYESALDLDEYAAKLCAQFPDVAIVEQVGRSVRESTELLLAHLTDQLRGNIRLPVCLRVIGFLRRLSGFDERQLRVNFLESRDDWIQDQLHAIPTSHPYNYLSKLTDSSRALLFDVLTQYRAIFSASSSAAASSRATSNGCVRSSPHRRFSQKEANEDEDENENEDDDDDDDDDDDEQQDLSEAHNLIVHSWLIGKVEEFCSQLRATLPKIGEGAQLNSLLDQSMYFAMSLGRVGADFRGLLPPLFEDASFRLFASLVDRALHTFERHLRQYNFQPLPRILTQYPGRSSPSKLDPPVALLQHLPLAVFANGCLAAFNEFRQCAAVGVRDQCGAHLRATLHAVANALVGIDRLPLSSVQRQTYAALCDNAATSLLPFIGQCLLHIYGVATLASLDTSVAIQLLKKQVK